MSSELSAPLSPEPHAGWDDHELLQLFRDGSEEAFTALVQRHVDAVYSSALRQVRDAHLAADVASAVFIVLARKAANISRRVVVAAWLHRTTRYAALKAVRAQVRRQHYEHEAARMDNAVTQEAAQWEEVAPLLDQGLTQLPARDHEAVLLRFFQKKSFPEIAGLVGSTEEGARKRVDRAVEKLRRFLAQRGVAIPAAGLTAVMGAQSVQAGPASLAQAIQALVAAHAWPPLAAETLRWLGWLRLKRLALRLAVPVLGLAIGLALLRRDGAAGTPMAAFQLLINAMNDGDGARWSSVVHVTNAQEEQARSVLGSNVVAQAELRRALIQRFGPAEYQASGFPRLLDDTPPDQIAGAVERVNGAQATVRLPRGSNLKFVKIGRAWKFDLFRTNPTAPVPLQASAERSSVRFRQTARQVGQGAFRSADEAWQSLQKR